MNISIITNKQCNFNCDFCYLSQIDKHNKNILDLNILKIRLNEILSKFNINYFESINIYGGEITLLNDEYIDELINLCKVYSKDIHIVSNGYIDKKFFYYPHIIKSISFDYNIREKYEDVANNIKKYKDINVLLLVSKEMYKKYSNEKILDIIYTLNNIKIKSINIIQYSQVNDIKIPYWYYDEFVFNFLKYKNLCNFEIENYSNLIKKKETNILSNNHIFINNDGRYSEIEYDNNGNEYFVYYDNLDDIVTFFNKEKELYNNNEFCNKCKFKGYCTGEHYRNVINDPKINSCSGNYILMEKFYETMGNK